MPIKIETDEEYHGGEGVSKSQLWKLFDKTPHHAKFGAYEDKPQFAMGKATHVAILEPERFESSVSKGPPDRRGNKWKEFLDFCKFHHTIPLVEEDYDLCMVIRDLSEGNEQLDLMRDGGHIVETSAYHVDEETGLLLKTRPDIYNPTHKLIADIKIMADASPAAFAKSVAKFGYHVQEASYSDIWEKGSEQEVEGFLFFVFEKSEPPVMAVYELDAPAVAEGHAIYRHAVKRWAECEAANEWPAYPQGVQPLSLARPWDYKMTTPPKGDE